MCLLFNVNLPGVRQPSESGQGMLGSTSARMAGPKIATRPICVVCLNSRPMLGVARRQPTERPTITIDSAAIAADSPLCISPEFQRLESQGPQPVGYSCTVVEVLHAPKHVYTNHTSVTGSSMQGLPSTCEGLGKQCVSAHFGDSLRMV